MTHSRECLANMIICAVENVRDSERITDEEFVSFAQTGAFYNEALAYLDDANLCSCPD